MMEKHGILLGCLRLEAENHKWNVAIRLGYKVSDQCPLNQCLLDSLNGALGQLGAIREQEGAK